jgi:hypothetical protein
MLNYFLWDDACDVFCFKAVVSILQGLVSAEDGGTEESQDMLNRAGVS